ncbi:MAG TPA: hypothetical protein VMU02_09755, partial [bacterium]|nr:hypothetical protein [bacterium]
LGAAYEHRSFSNAMLDRYHASVSGSGFSFGGMLYVRVPAYPSLDVIPTLSITYSSMDLRGEDPYGRVAYRDDQTTTLGFGAAFAFTLAHGQVLWALPSFLTAEGKSSFGIAVGIALPTRLLER